MPNKRTISKTATSVVNDRPIAAILQELTQEELSRLAADVVKENRQRLDQAQSLFERLEATRPEDGDAQHLRHAYRLALLELKVHHELVRIMVDELGYVPEAADDAKIH